MNGADTVQVERDVRSTPHLVWNALTDPEQVAAWFPPTDWELDSVEIDAQALGLQRLVMHDRTAPQVTAAVTARFTEVVADRLLVSHETVFGAGATDSMSIELRIELEDLAPGTRVRVTQGPFPAGVAVLARSGWVAALDRLAAQLGG